MFVQKKTFCVKKHICTLFFCLVVRILFFHHQTNVLINTMPKKKFFSFDCFKKRCQVNASFVPILECSKSCLFLCNLCRVRILKEVQTLVLLYRENPKNRTQTTKSGTPRSRLYCRIAHPN